MWMCGGECWASMNYWMRLIVRKCFECTNWVEKLNIHSAHLPKHISCSYLCLNILACAHMPIVLYCVLFYPFYTVKVRCSLHHLNLSQLCKYYILPHYTLWVSVKLEYSGNKDYIAHIAPRLSCKDSKWNSQPNLRFLSLPAKQSSSLDQIDKT